MVMTNVSTGTSPRLLPYQLHTDTYGLILRQVPSLPAASSTIRPRGGDHHPGRSLSSSTQTGLVESTFLSWSVTTSTDLTFPAGSSTPPPNFAPLWAAYCDTTQLPAE
jgi:hypothetical protein